MAPRYGRSARRACKGRHSLRSLEDHDLRCRAKAAPSLFVCSISRLARYAFESPCQEASRARTSPGAVIIMDNLSSHKGSTERNMSEDAGASLNMDRRNPPSLRESVEFSVIANPPTRA